MPWTDEPEPPALATVILYSGSVQGMITTKSHGFSVCYDALVRGMNYSQGRRLLLWVSLASQQPRRLADGGVEYTMPLPRPALIDSVEKCIHHPVQQKIRKPTLLSHNIFEI